MPRRTSTASWRTLGSTKAPTPILLSTWNELHAAEQTKSEQIKTRYWVKGLPLLCGDDYHVI